MPLIDAIAGYWDSVPCGSRHLNPTAQRYFVQPHIPSFADFTMWKDRRVLEIGCGIGTDTLQFVKAGARIDALDVSLESLKIAKNRFVDDGPLIYAQFFHQDAEKPLPFTWGNTYDLVYSFGVLHHTPRPEAVLQNASRCLKPDGELRIMLYAKWSWKHLFSGQQPEAQSGCPLVRWYSMAGAKRLVESCGFRVTYIRKTHIFPWRVGDYIEHRYVKAFPWNIVPHRWLEPWLGHHLLVKAVKA